MTTQNTGTLFRSTATSRESSGLRTPVTSVNIPFNNGTNLNYTQKSKLTRRVDFYVMTVTIPKSGHTQEYTKNSSLPTAFGKGVSCVCTPFKNDTCRLFTDKLSGTRRQSISVINVNT